MAAPSCIEPVIMTPTYFIITGMQRIVLYETKARFYLVGSNNTQTKFRVLKIHRTEPKELVVIDDKIEYSNREIRDLLMMIEHGNKTKQGQKGNSGMTRTVSAFGILGFVRFLEGYYLILITKRRRVAVVGHHTIYKIEETIMNYIPNDAVRYSHPDETRYVKMFQNVDLSSNFYFSYSYDLTHTLQYNLTVPKGLYSSTAETSTKDTIVYGIRTKPDQKFSWNWHLLKSVADNLHSDWLLNVVHGFVEQSNVSIYGRPIYVTLVARRSNKFAGTRFLKRGATVDGDVANEVETEQIVFDSSVSSLNNGHFSSFIQMRGSVPFYWSQDISKIVPKPPIIMERSDLYCCSAARHFNRLFFRHGTPVVVLNLVKKREKKKQESILSDELVETLDYLNQFLPPKQRIIHIGFDMARANKAKDANVLARLSDIAYESVKKTGIFHTRGDLFSHQLRPDSKWTNLKGVRVGKHLKQTGIVRVNCVDCLDRTNTAQFALGKVALAFQLYAFGVLETPTLCFDSDCVRQVTRCHLSQHNMADLYADLLDFTIKHAFFMLEELYEGHGDTLALQYGGSQLVHRIKTYRKTAPWSSQSRDIVHTLSRYYSNAFSDADKQNAINLYLGVFSPNENSPNIWELPTDYYLHHCKSNGDDISKDVTLTRWWDKNVLESLPLPCEQEAKTTSGDEVEVFCSDILDERLDAYYEYYRPFELTVLAELFAYTMNHSVRDFMPNFTTDFSPFTVRVRPGKRREEMGVSASTTNPSVTGKSSSTTSSTSSSADSSSGDEGSDFEMMSEVVTPATPQINVQPSECPLTFSKVLPSLKDVYGIELKEPGSHDVVLYKKYVQLGQCLHPPDKTFGKRLESKSISLISRSCFTLDSSASVTPPTVNRKSKDIYRSYVNTGLVGGNLPYHKDLLIYQYYASSKFV